MRLSRADCSRPTLTSCLATASMPTSSAPVSTRRPALSACVTLRVGSCYVCCRVVTSSMESVSTSGSRRIVPVLSAEQMPPRSTVTRTSRRTHNAPVDNGACCCPGGGTLLQIIGRVTGRDTQNAFILSALDPSGRTLDGVSVHLIRILSSALSENLSRE